MVPVTAGVKPGYTIGRDEAGLTGREREVLRLVVDGKNMPEIAEAIGITKQRVNQILNALVGKGRLEKDKHAYRVIVPRGD